MAHETRNPSEPICLGTTTLGERGQIVIPKEARDALGLKSGDHLMVLVPHDQAIGLIPVKNAKKFLTQMSKQIESIVK